MIKYFLCLSLALSSTFANEIVLDKIVGVFNEKIFSLSEIERIKKTLAPRVEMSPIVYTSGKLSQKQIVELLFDSYIIRDKLGNLGIIVTDDRVEAQIQESERRNGFRREDLINFLESKGFEFEEYFEVIRQSIEFNLFNTKIIAPLISITEQEVKNYFYRSNINKVQTLNFKYKLTDFVIPRDKVLEKDIPDLTRVFEEYRRSGHIPEIYKSFETIDIGEVNEEDLSGKVRSVLKLTEEGSFSKPITSGNYVHVYFVELKNLVESKIYLQAKRSIYNRLYMEKSQNIIRTWLNKERDGYYTVNLIK